MPPKILAAFLYITNCQIATCCINCHKPYVTAQAATNMSGYNTRCYLAFTSAPKGISDSLANLKHCFPNGIPIIMIHHNIPAMTKPMHKSIPPKIIQMTLSTGCLLKSKSTLFPKGQMIRPASLKHCLPKGIPIMVIHHIKPSKK